MKVFYCRHPISFHAREEAGYFLKQGCHAGVIMGDTVRVMLAGRGAGCLW